MQRLALCSLRRFQDTCANSSFPVAAVCQTCCNLGDRSAHLSSGTDQVRKSMPIVSGLDRSRGKINGLREKCRFGQQKTAATGKRVEQAIPQCHHPLSPLSGREMMQKVRKDIFLVFFAFVRHKKRSFRDTSAQLASCADLARFRFARERTLCTQQRAGCVCSTTLAATSKQPGPSC